MIQKNGAEILEELELEMMEDNASEKDQISYVLVFKLSRFGRNAVDVLKSIQTILDYDVNLVYAEDILGALLIAFTALMPVIAALASPSRY